MFETETEIFVLAFSCPSNDLDGEKIGWDSHIVNMHKT